MSSIGSRRSTSRGRVEDDAAGARAVRGAGAIGAVGGTEALSRGGGAETVGSGGLGA